MKIKRSLIVEISRYSIDHSDLEAASFCKWIVENCCQILLGSRTRILLSIVRSPQNVICERDKAIVDA